MKKRKRSKQFVSISRETDGKTLVSIHWNFEDPHTSGHALGAIACSLVRAFERTNPDKNREEIVRGIIEGMACVVDDEFLINQDNVHSVHLH